MARYIDADEFIKYEIKKNGCVPYIDGGGHNVDYLNDEVNNFPTADVQQIKHGKWKRTDDGAAYCTACKRKMNPHCYGYAYCSLCGAKMDGKED